MRLGRSSAIEQSIALSPSVIAARAHGSTTMIRSNVIHYTLSVILAEFIATSTNCARRCWRPGRAGVWAGRSRQTAASLLSRHSTRRDARQSETDVMSNGCNAARWLDDAFPRV